jgi:RNA polymerase-binding transcription factor DksA
MYDDIINFMDTNKYKKLLEEEKNKLESELLTIGRRDPASPNGWEAKETDLDSDSADENEVADEIEDYEDNQGIVDKLAIQLSMVEIALGKIEAGTYGKCNICGEEIPEARLNANPASLTCINHTK